MERADHAWFTAVHCFSQRPGAWILARWMLTHVECARGVRTISEERLVQATGWTESVIRRIFGEWQQMGMIEPPTVSQGRKRASDSSKFTRSDQVWELNTVGFAETLCTRLTRVAASIRAQSELECGCDVCDLGQHMPDEENRLVCIRCGVQVRTRSHTVTEEEFNSLPLVKAMQMYENWSTYSGEMWKLDAQPAPAAPRPTTAAPRPTLAAPQPAPPDEPLDGSDEEFDWEDVSLGVEESVTVDGRPTRLSEITEEDQLAMSREEYHRFFELVQALDKNTVYNQYA